MAAARRWTQPGGPTSKRPRRPTSPDGILIVDKPAGMTSHAVVSRLRGLCGTRAVGHAGTLDPMATGVLICGIGKGTKLLTYFSGADKEYLATIRLGISTTTDDAEGEITATRGASIDIIPTATDDAGPEIIAIPGAPVNVISSERLNVAIADLTGNIMQAPSSVSAIKVNGERAYKLARSGESIQLPPRPVTIHTFKVLTVVKNIITNTINTVIAGSTRNLCSTPVIDIEARISVSSGTYIRALARDLGEALGTGGHLTALRRTRIGPITIDEAETLQALEDQADAANSLSEPLGTVPLATAASWLLPTRAVSAEQAIDLGFGRFITRSGQPGVVAALGPEGELVALLEDVVRARGGPSEAKPVTVFQAAEPLAPAGDSQ